MVAGNSIVRWWIFVLVAAVACVNCSSRQEKFAQFMASGDQYMEKGDPVRATLEYKNAIQLDPKSSRAYLALAKAYLARKMHRQAYANFRKVLELDPARDDVRIQVAHMLAMGNQGRMALSELARLHAPRKQEPEASLVRALAHMNLGDFDTAVGILHDISNVSENPEAQVLLARCYRSLGRYKEMNQTVMAWRRLRPHSPRSYLFLAKFYQDQGQGEKAAAEVEKMLQAIPDMPKLRLHACRFFEQLGFNDRSETLYRTLPKEPAYQKAEAAFWQRRHRYDKAEGMLRRLSERYPGDVDAAVGLARLMALEGKAAEALGLIDGKLKTGDLTKPGRGRLLREKAAILAATGNNPEARFICDKILEENQGDLDAHLLLAKLLFQDKDYEAAILHLNQVVAARPGAVASRILLARCLFLNDKEILAVDTLEKGLKLTPDSPSLRLELVRYYLGRRESERALGVLDDGIDLRPDSVELLKTRGRLYVLQKNWKRAERDFLEIVRLQPAKSAGYMELGRMALARHRTGDAIGWFRKAAEQEDGFEAATTALVSCYLGKKDTDDALRLVKKGLAKYPGSARLLFWLGRTYLVRNELQKAESAFRKAAQQAPGWTDPYHGLADVYLKQGRLDEAVARIEQSYAKHPTPSEALNLAVLYEYVQRYDDAIRIYKELLAAGKKAPPIYNNLAYLYGRVGSDPKRLNEAADYVRKALEAQPKNPRFLDTAAWIAYKQGRLTEAWDLILKALAQDPNIGIHNLHAAEVALARKDSQTCREYLEKAVVQGLAPADRKEAERLQKQLAVP